VRAARDLLVPFVPAYVLGLVGVGCLAFTPPPDETISLGSTSEGLLHRGVALPDRGEGYVRARPGESTRYGTQHLVDTIERTVAEVARRFPGTEPMRIGDLSAPLGGRHHRHGSHRTGRDVDVLFYVTDPAGRSRRGRGWLAYNRFGYAVEHQAPSGEGGGPAGGLFFFDDARNWHFVRTLVLDEQAAVQWIFASRGVKSRLLRYGIAHEQDPRALLRAAYVLQEPSNASPHDDHFHVRVYCSARELAHGCENRGPIWPWLRLHREKPETAGEPLDDERLVAELLEPIDGTPDE
jgi:penicillin-insensitive murein DD-endopeptidase